MNVEWDFGLLRSPTKSGRLRFPDTFAIPEDEEGETLNLSCMDHQETFGHTLQFEATRSSDPNEFRLIWQGQVKVDGDRVHPFRFQVDKATLDAIIVEDGANVKEWLGQEASLEEKRGGGWLFK